MWLFFALISPLFWAAVHVLDFYCVDKIFEKPWMGSITSALASSVVFLAFPFIQSQLDWHSLRWELVVLALAIGGLIQLSQALYFQALSYSEVGIVAAYLNLTPTFLPFASFLFFGEILQAHHYVGIIILTFASLCFSLLDTNFSARWLTLLLMTTVSCLEVIVLLLEKVLYERETFWVGFLLITTGIIISGLFPLAMPQIRQTFRQNQSLLRPVIGLTLAIEIINLVALGSRQRAISLGIPSMVSAIGASVPAYTFGLSILLFLMTKRFGDPKAKKRLPFKLVLIVVMVLGIRLVAV
jgi:drug/metabolite transporter (DMT)-like permease